MKVVYSEEGSSIALDEKYILLEMDTIIVNNKNITAFAVMSFDEIPIEELSQIENMKKMHERMINGYKTQQWEFVLDCIYNLKGKWKGSIDSFYDIFEERVRTLLSTEHMEDWDYRIVQT